MNRVKSGLFFFVCIMQVAVLAGCATTRSVTTEGLETKRSLGYVVEGADTLLERHAPVFVTENSCFSYNQIGTPVVRMGDKGREEVVIDPSKATIYGQAISFRTEQGKYTNLIYRIHFERSPFTWKPFNPGAGPNVGFVTVITLDENETPILVNTVQSCGCYHAVLPTTYLPEVSYPKDWDTHQLEVYGEVLPGLLDFPDHGTVGARLVITLRSGTHRAKNIVVESMENLSRKHDLEKISLAPMESLKHLAMENGETSLYFSKGRKRGLVKGAFKPWETLLFGLWIGDSHVGQDREYGSKAGTGHRFYTSLNPWKKRKSDMWKYEQFLRLNGWKL